MLKVFKILFKKYSEEYFLHSKYRKPNKKFKNFYKTICIIIQLQAIVI